MSRGRSKKREEERGAGGKDGPKGQEDDWFNRPGVVRGCDSLVRDLEYLDAHRYFFLLLLG